MSPQNRDVRKPAIQFRLILIACAALWVGSSTSLAALASAQIWIDDDELVSLPTSGAAWNQLFEEANRAVIRPSLSDQDDLMNVRIFAKALVYARTGIEVYRADVIEACMRVMGTEGGDMLALSRNLMAYVLAADLVKLPKVEDARFRTWLRNVRNLKINGRTLISTHEDRPNNWGTHAGASRLAVAIYLNDTNEILRSAQVFRGWLGDRDIYSGFRFRELDWQCDPSRPVAVNPSGCTRNGLRLGGALPEELRRAGEFRNPPPRVNYSYEALQGALAQAVMLDRLGFDAFVWEDSAILRAFAWLYVDADFPAVGDDRWQIHILNRAYGIRIPVDAATSPGKNVGWSGWTHGLYEQ